MEIQFSKPLHKQLVAIANSKNISVATLVTQIIREYAKNQ